MRVAAGRVGATASKEMHTEGGAVGRGLMGEITAITCWAFTCLEEILADGHFARVVSV